MKDVVAMARIAGLLFEFQRLRIDFSFFIHGKCTQNLPSTHLLK